MMWMRSSSSSKARSAAPSASRRGDDRQHYAAGRSRENVILVAEMRDLETDLTALVARFQAM
jgi:hypothetical protein